MDILSSKPFVPASPMLTMNFKSQPLLDRRSMEESTQSHSEHSTEGRKPMLNGLAGGMGVPRVLSSDRPATKPVAPEHTQRSVSLNADAIRKSLSTPPGDVHVEPMTLHDKRPGAPRLKTLPPLNFTLREGEGRLPRMSPSVVMRAPPFPILELPPLPTPIAEVPGSSTAAASARRRRPQARLNSMPMLPMEGRDERENDPDHEQCQLDEEEEEDGDESDEESPEATSQSDDEDEEETRRRAPPRPSPSTPKQSSFLGRARANTSRLPDIRLGSSISSILGSPGIGSSGGSSAARAQAGTSNSSAVASKPVASASTEPQQHANKVPQPQDSEVATPRAAQRDYFSSALGSASATVTQASTNPDVRTSSYSASQRTPTAGTFASLHNAPAFSMQRITQSRADGRDGDLNRYESTASNTTAVPQLSKAEAGVGIDAKLTAKQRPSFYHHVSKSMVELFSSVAPAATPDRDRADGKGKGKHKGAGGADMSVAMLNSDSEPRARGRGGEATGDDSDMRSLVNRSTSTLDSSAPEPPPKTSTGMTNESAPAPSLKRQRSMPMFSESGPPPPYPSFLRPAVKGQGYHGISASSPRDDEGSEKLPPYSNDIYLAALMPRKMEFTAPGVPARDRKWRRIYCVLEGTMFKVYDAPPRVSGVSALGGWWERKVGVGDVTLGVPQSGSVVPGAGGTNVVIGRREPRRRMKWEEEQGALEAEMDAAGADGDAAGGAGTDQQSQQSTATTAQTHSHRGLKRHLAATLLHPGRAARMNGSAGNSRASSPGASPRSSLQLPMPRPSTDFGSGSGSGLASSAASSARPSADLSSGHGHSSSSAFASSMGSSTNMIGQNASSASLSSTAASASMSGSHLSVASHFRRHHGHHARSESAHVGSGLSASQSASRPSMDRSSSGRTTGHGHARSHSQPLNQLVRRPSEANSANTAATLPPPDQRDLQHIYSLQRAESGLASDYMKRKNVVRVRMEGEQFLLQCTDVAMVVEWIEVSFDRIQRKRCF